jgi:hypothetical protein
VMIVKQMIQPMRLPRSSSLLPALSRNIDQETDATRQRGAYIAFRSNFLL